MKKLFILCLLAVAATAVNAQILSFTSDTIKGDTTFVPSEYGVNILDTPDGVLSLSFTTVDIADSLSFAGLEYRNNTEDAWQTYTGGSVEVGKSVDGYHETSVTGYILGRFVRGRYSCAAGDTVAVTNGTLILKKD
jgi:hypothetical protein